MTRDNGWIDRGLEAEVDELFRVMAPGPSVPDALALRTLAEIERLEAEELRSAPISRPAGLTAGVALAGLLGLVYGPLLTLPASVGIAAVGLSYGLGLRHIANRTPV